MAEVTRVRWGWVGSNGRYIEDKISEPRQMGRLWCNGKTRGLVEWMIVERAREEVLRVSGADGREDECD